LLQGAHPEQAADTPPVDHQAQRQLQLAALGSEALQTEEFSSTGFRMAAVGEALEPPLLGGPQAVDPAHQDGLPQGRRISRQAS
jgi:hypothetical protein